MMPINATAEEVVIELLRKAGPCCLDDLVTYLPHLSWGEVFVAVDRMSREGQVSLRQLGYSTYQVTLRSPLSVARSTSGQKERESSLIG